MNKKLTPIQEGMATDTKHEYQPDGNYRYALNLVKETDKGELGSVSNERGTGLCFEHGLGDTFHLVGSCLIGESKVVLFFTDNNTTVIGVVEQCVFTELVRTECLNITIDYHVDIRYRIHNGCDTIIYFTDGHNKYRSINLDKLERYAQRGYADPNVLDPISGEYGWDCGLFNISPDYVQPDIKLESVSNGGRLRLGAYQFAVRYLDDQYNPTGWSLISNPVYITDSKDDSIVSGGTGGFLSLPDDDGFIYASKSINIIIDNLDTRYTYYQVAILQSTLDTFQVNEVHASDEFFIDSSTGKYSLTTTDGMRTLATIEVVVNNRVLGIVKEHAQVESKLLLGNLVSIQNDWQEYQRIANDIKTEYFVYTGEEDFDHVCEYDTAYSQNKRNDDTRVGYGDPILTFDNKTYMRDEVYALGIVFVFKDGSESPVMHIPGRPKIGLSIDSIPVYNVENRVYGPITGDVYFALLNENYRIPAPDNTDRWDDWDYSVDTGFSTGNNYQFGNGAAPETNSIHILEDIYTKSGCTVDSVPRWKHINTSIKNPGVPTFDMPYRKYKIDEIGIMGYFETDTTYPDVKGCDGLPIFPYYLDGNGDIVMHKIRHHRMPDSRKVPIFKNLSALSVSIRSVGVIFSNLTIPTHIEEQLQGYYFVRSNRAGNRTIIDKGVMNVCDLSVGRNASAQPADLAAANKIIQPNVLFMSPHFKEGMGSAGNEKNPEREGGFDIVEVFSPKMMYNTITNIGPTHFKLENTFYGNVGVDFVNSQSRLFMWSFLTNIEQPRISTYGNRNWYLLHHHVPIDGTEFALYNQTSASTVRNEFLIKNEEYRQTIGIASLWGDRYWNDSINYFKLFNRPYQYVTINEANGQILSGVPDLVPTNFYVGFNQSTPDFGPNRGWGDNVVNITLDSWVSRALDTPDGYQGNVQLRSAAYCYYVALKSSIIPYRKLETIKYIRCTNYIMRGDTSLSNPKLVTGGDTFISPHTLFKAWADNKATNENNRKYISSNMTMIIESEINGNYRHKETGDLYKAFPFDSNRVVLYDQMEELRTEIRDTIENIFRFRVDLSKDNDARTLMSLPDYYDYCADCQEEFPNLIVHSNPTTSEQVFDNYRQFSPNSIIEIPPDTGDITGMTVKENNLFVHTTGNTWRLNISSQQLETNNDTLQVGSASLANATPSKLFDNDEGVFRGGIEYSEAGVHCDDSYIWPDSFSGHVYALQGGAKEISNKGMRRFFDMNLPIEFNRQFRKLYKIAYGKEGNYPHQSTSSKKTVGLTGVFDPDIKRYILVKKDYILLPALESSVLPLPESNYTPNALYISEDGYYLGIDSNTIERLQLDNKELFINKSWTISYDLKTESWISFHSYIPNHMFRDDYNFYSFVANSNASRSGKVWKHNTGLFTNYYGTKFNFELELVHKGDLYQDFTFDNVELVANAYEYSSLENDWVEKQWSTVTGLYAYNNNQITGYKDVDVANLNPYARVNYNVNRVTAAKDRNVWRISRLRDLSITRDVGNVAMFSTNWNSIYQDSFDTGFGYIDKIINPNYISIAKNVYQMERLTDKYLAVRYYYRPDENYKLTINIFNTLHRNKT